MLPRVSLGVLVGSHPRHAAFCCPLASLELFMLLCKSSSRQSTLSFACKVKTDENTNLSANPSVGKTPSIIGSKMNKPSCLLKLQGNIPFSFSFPSSYPFHFPYLQFKQKWLRLWVKIDKQMLKYTKGDHLEKIQINDFYITLSWPHH